MSKKLEIKPPQRNAQDRQLQQKNLRMRPTQRNAQKRKLKKNDLRIWLKKKD
jgi:hypothetical protein